MTKSSWRKASALKSVHSPLPADGLVGADTLLPHRGQAVSLWLDHLASTTVTVSIVICTRNRPDHLRECLEHVSALTPPADEVIVVDNSGGDEETEYLARVFGARYVLERTPGLSRARNRGLAESHCDIVAYLDDDCIPDSRWLDHLLRPFADERVAAVAGDIIRFTDKNARLQEAYREFEQMRYLNQETPCWFEIASFGGVGSGGNMAFRKRSCTGSALFDERLGRGAPFRIAEENCAFASLLADGYSTVRTPAARVYHPAKPRDLEQEATSTIAYWLLLFTKFPANRPDLLFFLLRRAMRRRLAWRLNTQNVAGIVSSGWRVKLKAIVYGVALFFRARRFHAERESNVQIPTLSIISRRRTQSRSVAIP